MQTKEDDARAEKSGQQGAQIAGRDQQITQQKGHGGKMARLYPPHFAGTQSIEVKWLVQTRRLD